MRPARLVAAGTVAVLCAAAVAADRLLPAAASLPMQWDWRGVPTWHAPRWIALAAVPAVATAVFAIDTARRPRDATGALRTAAIGAAILALGYGLHLWLIWRSLRPGGG